MILEPSASRLEVRELLHRPFSPVELEWEQAGPLQDDLVRLVPRLSSRAIMDRLDCVVGPEGWRDSYREGPAGTTLCRLELQIDHTWSHKENMSHDDPFGAAALKWGVGRYLMRLPPIWMLTINGLPPVGSSNGVRVRGPDGQKAWVRRPSLPKWAVPGPTQRGETETSRRQRQWEHHPTWGPERRRFCASLGNLGIRYDDLSAYLRTKGVARPSQMDAVERRELHLWLQNGGADKVRRSA